VYEYSPFECLSLRVCSALSYCCIMFVVNDNYMHNRACWWGAQLRKEPQSRTPLIKPAFSLLILKQETFTIVVKLTLRRTSHV